MKKLVFILSIISILVVMACAQRQIACTADAKICPDGTAVGRTGPNCEFALCPETEPSDGIPGCDYDDQSKSYIEKSPDACETIKYLCAQDKEPFSDQCGCGCRVRESANRTNYNSTGVDLSKQTYCSPEQRQGDFCIELYQPVCGWLDPKRVQCIKYPCAQVFSNSCYACHDDKVLYWTEGECPK